MRWNSLVCYLFFLAVKCVSSSVELLPSTVLLNQSIDVNIHPKRWTKKWNEKNVRKYFVTSRGSDGEFIDASNHFFWNKTDGIAMELGAVDGIQLSETRPFVDFGWNRILVEANPRYIPRLRMNRNAAIINAAVCDVSRTVHFFDNNHGSGIVEFTKLTDSQKEGLVKKAAKVQCLPLSSIFAGINVTHVNFFVLDVEGAELSVLQSIDWTKVSFDVLSIETERDKRRPGYVEDVTAFMLSKNYVVVDNISGRNTWFTRVGFVPSRRPTIAEGCFSGSLWATRWRNRNGTQQENFKKCPDGFFYGDKCQNCPMLPPPSSNHSESVPPIVSS
mmetsp:Transcript_18261/g.30452  ORF Transcript_18261/g.30452 Transcript_18261/m.30452 type:complete len:331 (-) Transcript_18261:103-1095(-)